MAQALDILDFGRRGACPTLHAPMRTGDGLLARVRVAGGRTTPAQMGELARLAMVHGNGLVEVTARGNLQIRGLTPASSWPFAEAVSALLSIETGLVVDVPPIAGEDPAEEADPTVMARAIRDGVAQFEHRLGPKVSVVVDGGGQVRLGALKADVRLQALGDELWSVAVGGADEMLLTGETAVAAAVRALRALAELGPEARAVDLPAAGPHPAARGRRSTAIEARQANDAGGKPPPRSGGGEVGVGQSLQLVSGTTTPIALPFGAVLAGALLELAEAATGTIRLSPAHMLLLDNAPPALLETAEALGFIVSADDPRLRISACIGSDGCASGFVPARRLAGRLAGNLPPGKTLHVSGCAKGCARPRPAEVTLVGRADGIGLVIGGRAGDTASQVLDEAGVFAALADLDGP